MSYLRPFSPNRFEVLSIIINQRHPVDKEDPRCQKRSLRHTCKRLLIAVAAKRTLSEKQDQRQ